MDTHRADDTLASSPALPADATLTTAELGQPKSRRGFAAMSQDKQRQIAKLGGQLAHACGRAHKFTSEEAQAAGRKGGASVSQDRAHMAAIGSHGGKQRWERIRASH